MAKLFCGGGWLAVLIVWAPLPLSAGDTANVIKTAALHIAPGSILVYAVAAVALQGSPVVTASARIRMALDVLEQRADDERGRVWRASIVQKEITLILEALPQLILDETARAEAHVIAVADFCRSVTRTMGHATNSIAAEISLLEHWLRLSVPHVPVLITRRGPQHDNELVPSLSLFCGAVQAIRLRIKTTPIAIKVEKRRGTLAVRLTGESPATTANLRLRRATHEQAASLGVARPAWRPVSQRWSSLYRTPRWVIRAAVCICGFILVLYRAFVSPLVSDVSYDPRLDILTWSAWALVVPALLSAAVASARRGRNVARGIAGSTFANTVAAMIIGVGCASVLSLEDLIGSGGTQEVLRAVIFTAVNSSLEMQIFASLLLCLVAFVTWSELRARAAHGRARQGERVIGQSLSSLLATQLRPHFLYNVLGSVSSLVDEDARAASNVARGLVEFHRTCEQVAHRERIPLSTEFQLAHAYVALVSGESSAPISLSIEASKEAGMAAVLPLMLQPLVENAVRYAYPRNHRRVISIKAAVDQSSLKIIVSNALGPGHRTAPAAGRTGTGLSNLRERLRLIEGAPPRLMIRESLDRFQVIIHLPFVMVSALTET